MVSFTSTSSCEEGLLILMCIFNKAVSLRKVQVQKDSSVCPNMTVQA